MKSPAIFIENASLAYAEKIIFSQLNLQIPAGKWTALLGPSGIGKTSLLRFIAGLATKNEKIQGAIFSDQEAPIHQQVAYMAQTDLLFPWLTVLDNTLIAAQLRGKTSKASIEKAIHLLGQVGLSHALHLYPHQLSGGMRQRVALVRTLMKNKPIILMDEPFSALDAITRYKLQDLAANLLAEKTVLFITHDPTEALRLANDIYIMQGQPAQLKLITQQAAKPPHQLSNPALQSLLFQELLNAEEKQ